MITLHRKCDIMEGKLKNQERLLQNQKWEYSAPRPSEEYWNSLAETDEDENETEEFRGKI